MTGNRIGDSWSSWLWEVASHAPGTQDVFLGFHKQGTLHIDDLQVLAVDTVCRRHRPAAVASVRGLASDRLRWTVLHFLRLRLDAVKGLAGASPQIAVSPETNRRAWE